ncbi:MAG TPA: methyltransferase domain-containing protein [Thioploca sp.]|nr:MAG: methyltransferase [Gammaproteobacteria bacterium]HDN25773.1 methyltransferase domain-containing protein [Thioploca sp.]
MEQNQLELENQLFNMMWGHYVSGSLRTIADLAVADYLKESARTADELANEIGCHARSLYRVMRALATVGIFEQQGDKFSLTPLGNLLRSDIPRSQRATVIEMCSYFEAWEKLTEIVKTGNPPKESSYNYVLASEEKAKLFYDGMDSFYYDNPAPMLGSYDFSDAETVMDVGGGSGSQLIAVLKHYPHLKGILFDLPDTVKRSKANIEAAGLANRCFVAGGSFLDAVPSGADIYMMRHVIHDWDDSKSVEILKNVRAVLPDHGRVLVIETLVSGREKESFAVWFDLAMFAIDGGAERTREEYAELFEKAGLKLNRVVPTKVEVSVVEAVKGRSN